MYILLRSRGRLRFAPPFEMLRSAPHFFCVGCLIYKILNTVGTVSAPYLRGTVSHSLHTYNRGNRFRSVPPRNRFPLTPYLQPWEPFPLRTYAEPFPTHSIPYITAPYVEKYPLSYVKPIFCHYTRHNRGKISAFLRKSSAKPIFCHYLDTL